jgi:hypothetical protein
MGGKDGDLRWPDDTMKAKQSTLFSSDQVEHEGVTSIGGVGSFRILPCAPEARKGRGGWARGRMDRDGGRSLPPILPVGATRRPR